MPRKIVTLLVSIWLTAAVGGLRVRGERLPITVYTSADGLGSAFIDFLMGDSRGFMWFCTRDGLSRFDGARFVTYRVGDRNSPPGIERISETGGGVYWITTTRGLYRFQADTLSRPEASNGDRPFLNAQFIDNVRGTVLEDRAGNLWYVGGDLYRLKEQGGKVMFEKASLNLQPNQTHPLAIFQMREAPDGSFWITTNQGIVRRLPDGRVILYRHVTDLRLGAVSLTIDGSGRVWVVWGQDFFIIKPPALDSLKDVPQSSEQPLTPNLFASTDPDREILLPQTPGDVLSLKETALVSQTRQIKRLFRSSDDHVWFTSGEELLEFDGNVFHAYGSAQGFPTGMAEMAQDSAGNLWIAGQAALLRLNRRGLTSYTEVDGLNSARLYAINEAQDGSLYFANGDFYLSRFDGKKFQSIRPHIDSAARALWTSRYAFLSSANEWWILTTDRLYRFAASSLQKPKAIYDINHGLKANEAFQIFEDSQGNIWLSQQPSTVENFGLYRLKRGEDRFYRFSQAQNLPAGKAASSFAEDQQGNLWFGFYEGGLVRFANDRFQLFTTRDGLPGGLIIDMHVDRKGRLWLASSLEGVRRIDEPGAEKPIFVSYTTANGLTSNNARTITEDKQGNIYVGTVRGVDRISPETNQIKHYSVSDGLAGDFVVVSHCDRNGVLWFATTNGLSRLTPMMPDETRSSPKVLLGGLRIAGEEQSVSELGDAEIQTGDLGPTRNNLQIDYFGLDFRPGETLRYQLMLEGADSSWSQPTEQRTVTYANLKPGSYRFVVRAVSADGLVSEKPASVTFRILPPIWLRWWFLTLTALLTLVLLYCFYRYRMARLREVNAALAEAKRAEEHLGRAREERLTELARVRTRIATDLHDDIGASLTQIAILSEVVRQQSLQGNGASLDPLNSIVNVSNELVETMSDIVWAINPRKDHLRDLIQRMRRFASDLLIAKGISLAFDVPTFAPEIPLGANARREVFLIFKESLTNIVKHSGATEVSINVDFSSDQLTLKVADNGQGFEVGKVSNGLFSSAKGGHGILSMKKRAAEMNANLDINSNNGQGTRITFQLPLDPATRHAHEAPT